MANSELSALLKQFEGMSYNAPDISKSMNFGNYKAPSYKKFNYTPYDFKASDFGSLVEGKNKKKGTGINVFDMLSSTFGLPGGLVTRGANNFLEDIKGFDKDKPLQSTLGVLANLNLSNVIGEALVDGGKKQWSNWQNGMFNQWGDIPGVGLLDGINDTSARGSDIMENLGVKNKWGKVGGGLAIDILADPLTYMTGGLSTATKLSKVKELEKIVDAQKALNATGVKVTGKFKSTDDFLNASYDSLKTKYPTMPDRIINKKIERIRSDINVAKNQVYNANINKIGVSVPFSNKMTTAVADISPKSLLYRSEATLGSRYRHIADSLIDSVSKGDNDKKTQLTNAILKRYGVNSLDDLSKSHFDDLATKIGSLSKGSKPLPDSKITEKILQKEMPNNIYNIKTRKGTPNENVSYSKTSSDDILKSLDPKVAEKLKGMIKGLDDVEDIRKLAPDAAKMFGEFAPKIMKTVKGKTAKNVKESFDEAAETLKNVTHKGKITKEKPIPYTEIERLVEIMAKGNPALKAMQGNKAFYKQISDLVNNQYDGMGNFKNKFEHFLDAKNPFDARTLRTGDKFLDSMADHIADGNSQRVGENAKYSKALSKIESFIKKNKISDKEMQEAIYHLEGKAPKSYGKDWKPSDKVVELANMIKPMLKQLSDEELAAGTLTKTRKNYFPHVLNKSEAELKEIMEKVKRHDLDGNKSTSKHDQARKSFQTLADRDNYIAKLEKLIQKATDPAEKEALIDEQKRLAEIFDTDIVSALTRRVREGVRAKAMKAMQGKLSRFGMMVSNPEDLPPAGLKKLDPEEARKLGLEKGTHYVHPDVLDGMKRVDEIFTNQGMNKIVRHLNATTDIWKNFVTTFKPSHYRNNVVGNVINNILAGTKTSDYKKAASLIKRYRSGKLTPSEQKIMDKAYKHNVISGGFMTDNMFNYHFDDPLKIEKAAQWVSQNKVTKKIRAGGEIFDDVTRLANFVGGMRQFGSTEKAAQQVRKYLFNYNELTSADRAMRVAVPFWNWTKRNVPLQMNLLLENPKFAMNIERFKNFFNDEEKGEDWQKETGIKVPQPIADLFGAKNKEYYTSLPSSTNELGSMIDPLSYLGSMAPVPRMLIEGQMNKTMFTGAPISYGENDVQSKDIPGYLARNFGITNNIQEVATGEKTFGEFLHNLLNPIYEVKE